MCGFILVNRPTIPIVMLLWYITLFLTNHSIQYLNDGNQNQELHKFFSGAIL